MNVVIHQVRTDLRRLRWWLVAWGVLLAGATVVPSLKLDLLAGSDASASRLLAAHAVLLNAVALFGWVITVQIVHGDPLDGTTAFWLTRPLSPRQLFTAKIGPPLVLFVLLPSVAGAVAAAANGATGRIVFACFAESALVWLVFSLAVMLPATLTRDLARLVLTGIATGIAWLTLHALLFGFVSMAPTTTRAAARYSGLLVGAIWFCAGCLAIIAGQYVSRRTRRSLLLAAALASSTLGVVTFWPWPLLVPRRPVSDAAFNPASVEVSLSAVARRPPAASSYLGDVRYSPGDFQAADVPAGWVVAPFTVDATLRLSDGATVAYHDDTWLSHIGTFETSSVFGMARPGFHAVGYAARGRWLNDPWVPSTDASKERDGRAIDLTIFEVPADHS